MHWLVFLLLIGLGLILSLASIRAGVFDLVVELPVDLDLLLIVTGILLVMTAIIGIIFKQGMERVRLASVATAREEAFSEHRRFLRRLDHELKNPLTAILAGIANLRESSCLPDHEPILDSIQSQTLRLSGLVTDLRKLTEIETLPLEQEPVDLPQLLQESIELVQERADADDRKLVFSVAQRLQPYPKVIGDRDLLLLALHNLIDNAVKFTGPGDIIEVEARVEEDSAVIVIRDTGIGIPDAELPLVWEELYRGQGAARTFGSGIGLALVQVIVKRTGGTISITSHVGEGTQLTLRFPLSVS